MPTDDDPWSPRPPRRTSAASTRLFLDLRVAPLRGLDLVPAGGWIRTARRAVAMSSATLGRRAGISARRVLQVEGAELAGHVRIDTMRRLAAALDCRFVYAFVPETSFEELVLEQALRVSPQHLAHAAWAVGLGEEPLPILTREQLERVADQLATHRTLWR